MDVRVRSGDTLVYYSQLYHVPLELLLDSNKSVNPSNLKISEKINVPGYVSIPYKIKKNDTLWKIATSMNFPIDAISLLNQKLEPKKLTKDQTIFVPEKITKPIISSKLPLDSSSMKKQLSQLERDFPFISVKAIGLSVLNHPIQEIQIGKGLKKVHMNASFHANEWITSMILMNLVNTFLLSLTNQKQMNGVDPLKLYNEVELSIVPLVNPDGVDLVLNGPPEFLREELINMNAGCGDFIHWKANIRGVDLNNQFPANWEIEKERKLPKSPASRDFPGRCPLTEPEAVAMANLVQTNQFDRVLAFHTQGEEFYWGYEGFEPPESEAIAIEFERVSGYRAIRNVDSHAGFKDWFIQEYKRPGFTLELGKGINPLPLSHYHEIREKVEGIFLAALYY